MKMKSGTMVIILLLVIFGGILLAEQLGLWVTQNDQISSGGNSGQGREVVLVPDPSEIRGSTTFASLLESFPIDQSVLYAAFMIPETMDPALLRSGDLESLFEETSIEIGNESMKIFIALYMGLDIELEATGFPQAAVDLILKKQPELDDAIRSYLEENTVDARPLENPEIEVEDHEAEAEENSLELIQISGSTLFGDLLEMGLTVEGLEDLFGEAYPGDQVRVKDYIESLGLEYSTVKKSIEALTGEE
ncbi:MAG: hypothetical protein AVO33_04565 [delta proteobacterium ML8_F1]|nr:MAG: hypothetical protein AVO33_04565 [delta proteobacterium ML8_F1]